MVWFLCLVTTDFDFGGVFSEWIYRFCSVKLATRYRAWRTGHKVIFANTTLVLTSSSSSSSVYLKASCTTFPEWLTPGYRDDCLESRLLTWFMLIIIITNIIITIFIIITISTPGDRDDRLDLVHPHPHNHHHQHHHQHHQHHHCNLHYHQNITTRWSWWSSWLGSSSSS